MSKKLFVKNGNFLKVSFKFLFKMHQSRGKYFMNYVSSFSTLPTILSEILHKIFQVPFTVDFDHHLLRRVNILSLREKCPYSEFFRSVFSRIWTEYRPENCEYGHFTQYYKHILNLISVFQ